jgi:hypothetical protein
VVLQGDVVRLRGQPYQQFPAGVLGADLQDPRQRESALVQQRPAGLGVQVVQVLQQQRGQGPPAQRDGGLGQQLVQVGGAGDGPVGGVEAERAAQGAGLVAQPVAVPAPRQRRTPAEDGFGQPGRVRLPLLPLGEIADAEPAADVHGPRPQPPAPARLQCGQAPFEGGRLLRDARRVQMKGHPPRIDRVGMPLDRLQQQLQLPYRRAEAAAPAQHLHARRLEARQPQQHPHRGERVLAHQGGELVQLGDGIDADRDARTRRQPQELGVLRPRGRDPVGAETGTQRVLQLAQRRDVHARVRRGEPPQQRTGPVGLVGVEDLPRQVVRPVHRPEPLQVLGDLVRHHDVQGRAERVGE